jgi:hypothetical protein
MKPDFSKADQGRTVSPHAQEVEYALILSRMISTVKDDPAQMRLTIYEFARARLKLDTSFAEEAERQRLSAALETAIQGVEQFSVRREDKERLPPPNQAVQIAQSPPVAAAAPPSVSLATVAPLTPAAQDIFVPERPYRRPDAEPIVEARTRALVAMLAKFSVGMLLFGMVAGLAYYKQRLPALRGMLDLPSPTASMATKPLIQQPVAVATPSGAPPVPAEAKPSGAASNPLPFPVPGDYGIYALSVNDALSELFPLPERVPDKRIAMSTPINLPSRTTVPDGKARFIVFRRDLVGNTPDRIEVRVVARVTRAWNIRNLSYEFRVRPVPGNPEMLLVQSEKADFELPAGRYILVLRDQGYDFTVAGKVTDLAQCLERTDAANGAFYSECQKL